MSIQLYSSPMKYKDPTTGNYVDIIGISGNPGRGIASVVLNNDYTLTINLTDNTSITTGAIRGATGVGISSIAKTGTSANVDTYTITYTDNNTTTFSITNGVTPSFTIGTVVEGAEAAATITGTSANPILNLVLPAAAVSGKADKVSGATSGNFAALDANGNLTDSGHKDDNYARKTDTILETTLSCGRNENTTVGLSSFAFGAGVEASNTLSHAEGMLTKATGVGAHTEGMQTIASGMWSHAENGINVMGESTIASGNFSHAEGMGTEAAGASSHAEGYKTKANGDYTHVEGVGTIANGRASSASGRYNIEDTYNSWSEWVANTSYQVGDKVKVTTTVDSTTTIQGYICKTANSDSSFTSSKWTTDAYMNYADIIGNGTADNARSNAYALDWDGTGHFKGDVYVHANTDSSGGTKLATVNEIPNVPVQDVQLDGSSIVSSGVANIPYANENSTYGIVKAGEGLYAVNGQLNTSRATSYYIKNGTDYYRPIVPNLQHESVFYGLAKAAGDSTQSSSSNSVGTYTESAKGKIQSMLGITNLISTDESTLVASKAYAIGDVFCANGKMYKATAEIASGATIVVEGNGANASEVKIEGTFVKKTDYATNSTPGVVKTNRDYGIDLTDTGILQIAWAADSSIKSGDTLWRLITPGNQHTSVFYGLAKAAGDSTQAVSDNAVGTYTDDAKSAIRSMIGAVGNTDYATNSKGGVVKVDSSYGILISSGTLRLNTASSSIKAGTVDYLPIVPKYQHTSVFYGLAKAAGDSTQSSSSNAVGTYTATAKAKIQTMLGVENGVSFVETVSGSTPSITGEPNTRYVCGEVSTLAITTPSVGTIDVVFDSGSTATVLTVTPPTGTTMKWPSWFDPTALVANTSYELLITDGVYGGVMTWGT